MSGVASRFARALSGALLLCLGGCKQILDVPDDPQLVGPKHEGPWWCLDEPAATTPSDSDAALVKVQACNFVSPKCAEPVTDFTADLCGKLDVKCANPLQTGIRESGGALEFAVPTGGELGTGFDGYLRLRPKTANCTDTDAFGEVGPLLCALLGAECDPTLPNDPDCEFPVFVSSLLFFNPPVQKDVDRPIPLPLVPTREAQTLIAAAGGRFNPAAGIVFTTSVDCNGEPAPDVALTIDKHQDVVSELYSQNGVISSTATSTDDSGLGGFIGVPEGFVEVTAYVDNDESGSKKIGEAGVNVEAFTISYTNLAPSE
jgi:hypothetical protein